jgi:hypothetical protein
MGKCLPPLRGVLANDARKLGPGRSVSGPCQPTYPRSGAAPPWYTIRVPVAGPWDAFLGLHGPATGTVPLYFCHDGPATGTVLSRYRYRASRLGDRVLFLWRPTHEILRRE